MVGLRSDISKSQAFPTATWLNCGTTTEHESDEARLQNMFNQEAKAQAVGGHFALEESPKLNIWDFYIWHNIMSAVG